MNRVVLLIISALICGMATVSAESSKVSEIDWLQINYAYD